jgi:hypothetical protein
MSGAISATTLAAASLGLTAVGTGLSVYGMINQQQAAGAQANYQRAMALRQQQINDWQAKDAMQRGEVAEQQQRAKTAQMLGSQTAKLAAQGTDLSGSPTDILGDTARAGEFDALTIRNNAVREAWGYQVGAGNAGAAAGMYGSFQPSYLGAGASLLSGASTLADKWSRFQDTGALGGRGSYTDPNANLSGFNGNGPLGPTGRA